MASRKMTFTIPDDVAAQLLRRVPSRDRSHYVTEAIAARLHEREERLIRACEAANRCPDVARIERDWEAVTAGGDPVSEPWDDAAAR